MNNAEVMKCSKCERKVEQTMHTADGAKVDYYIVSAGEPPVVLCVGCYKEREDE